MIPWHFKQHLKIKIWGHGILWEFPRHMLFVRIDGIICDAVTLDKN